MAVSDVKEILVKYCLLLENGGFSPMVVGAHAVFTYGFARGTNDVDLVLRVGRDSVPAVRRLLESAGCEEIIEKNDPIFGFCLRTIIPEGLLLEVFITPETDVHQREFDRRIPRDVDGRRIWVLSPEDLVLRKLVNTRFRRGPDYDDVVGVLQALGEEIDLAYIRKHCGVYRVCGLLDKALSEAREDLESS